MASCYKIDIDIDSENLMNLFKTKKNNYLRSGQVTN